MENRPAGSDSPPWEEVQEIFASPTILSELEQQEARKIAAYSDSFRNKVNILNIISIFLTAIGTVFLFAAFPQLPQGLGYRLGYIGIGLTVFAGFSWLLSRLVLRIFLRRKKHLRLLCFALIFFGISCWSLGNAILQNPIVSAAGNTAAEAKPDSTSAASFADSSFKEKYDLELRHTLIKMLWEIQEQQIPPMLTHEVMDSKANMKKYQAQLKTVLGILTEYDIRLRQQYAQWDKEAASLSFTDDTQRSIFLKQYNDMKAVRGQYLTEYFNTEKALVQDMHSLLAFLEQHYGGYTLRDGRAVFKVSGDAVSFNKLYAAISELQQKEASARYSLDACVMEDTRVIEDSQK